ncbi:hypothetical protein [Micromonospora sp. NPDC000018]|uniref:hypothetical protein n=1 Tax=Micromonospora sp. NPDC000018 TaxID=3154239 RepID=UPI00332E2048
MKIDIHQVNDERRAVAGGFQPRPSTGDLRRRDRMVAARAGALIWCTMEVAGSAAVRLSP